MLEFLAIATLATLAFNAFSTMSTNETNREIHEEDREFNRQERLETQAWNSPSQMIARGQAAGLNRMASLGLPASAASTSPSPNPMVPFQANTDWLNQALSASSGSAQNEADARLKEAQSQNVALSNAFVNQKNELDILKSIRELDHMDIDYDLKESMRDNYMQQLAHNRKMSTLLQENQSAQNRFIEQQREESIQRIVESRARVVNDNLRVKLESQKVRSELDLNKQQAMMFYENARKLNAEMLHVSFEENMETRKQNFLEKIESADLDLRTLDTKARCGLARYEIEMAGLNLEQLARERDSEISAGFERVFGVSFKDVLGVAPSIVVGTGKFGGPAPVPVRGFRP